MEIVEDRYGRSTLIASRLPVDTWHAVIGSGSWATLRRT